jgi:hypothetical protein
VELIIQFLMGTFVVVGIIGLFVPDSTSASGRDGGAGYDGGGSSGDGGYGGGGDGGD